MLPPPHAVYHVLMLPPTHAAVPPLSLSKAVFEFKWMLHNGVMSDGQWHEPSTRYHGRVLAAFIPFAYALKQAKVMDAFNEILEFKKFVGYYRSESAK